MNRTYFLVAEGAGVEACACSFAAVFAVADDAWAEVAGNRVADLAAEAGTGEGHLCWSIGDLPLPGLLTFVEY